MPVPSISSSHSGEIDEELPSYTAGPSSHHAVAGSSSQPVEGGSSYNPHGTDAYQQQPPSYLATTYAGAGESESARPNLSPAQQQKRDHVLRNTVASGRDLGKVREKINKGGDPTGTSSKHAQNAFHKAALAPNPKVDTVDVLKGAVGDQDRLHAALRSQDKDGRSPVDIATDRAAQTRDPREKSQLQAMAYRLDPTRRG
jgi:hypothetical protein